MVRPVGYGLPRVGRAQGFVPQAGKVHVGAGGVCPVRAAPGGRQVEIIRAQQGAAGQLRRQCVGKGGLAAAAAAVQRQHQRAGGLLRQRSAQQRRQGGRGDGCGHGFGLLGRGAPQGADPIIPHYIITAAGRVARVWFAINNFFVGRA